MTASDIKKENATTGAAAAKGTRWQARYLPPLGNHSRLREWLTRWTQQKTVYPQSLASYAAAYNTTTRAIKRWIKIGKHRGDLPPLSNRRRLWAWYKRHHVRINKAVIRNIGQDSQDELALTIRE